MRKYIENFDWIENPKLIKETGKFEILGKINRHNEYNKYRYLMNHQLPFTRIKLNQELNRSTTSDGIADLYRNFLNEIKQYYKFFMVAIEMSRVVYTDGVMYKRIKF